MSIAATPSHTGPKASSTALRITKAEILRILRERQERNLPLFDSQSTTTTSSAITLSREAMGGLISGIAGGAIIATLIFVWIVVPLWRRRAMTAKVLGEMKERKVINLDDPAEEKAEAGLGGPVPVQSIGGRDDLEKPLLGRASTPGTPKRASQARISTPQSVQYPSQSSTHVYEFPQPPSSLDHKRMSVYHQTVSTTAGVPFDNDTEFDPYSPFSDTPNPLDRRGRFYSPSP